MIFDGLISSFIEEDNLISINFNPNTPNFTILSESYSNLRSSNSESELIGVRSIRKLLQIEIDCPIEEVIQSNIVLYLIPMAFSRNAEFIIDVCCILCNIASGDHLCTKYLLDIGALEFFDKVFEVNSKNHALLEQILWAVGNIAIDRVEHRNIVTNSNIFQKVLEFSNKVCLNILGNRNAIAWVLGTFVKFLPLPSIDICLNIEKNLTMIVIKNTDSQILNDSVKGLAILSDNFMNLQYYNDLILSKLVKICDEDSDYKLVGYALRVLNNYVTNFRNMSQNLIQFKILNTLLKLEKNNFSKTRKFSIKLASVICAENEFAIKCLMEKKYFTFLFEGYSLENEEMKLIIIELICGCLKIVPKSVIEAFFEEGWVRKIEEYFEVGQENSKSLICEALSVCYCKAIHLIPDGYLRKVQEMQGAKGLNESSKQALVVLKSSILQKLKNTEENPNKSV